MRQSTASAARFLNVGVFAAGGACKAVKTTPLLTAEEAVEAMKKAQCVSVFAGGTNLVFEKAFREVIDLEMNSAARKCARVVG